MACSIHRVAGVRSMTGPKRLLMPAPVAISATPDGRPVRVGGREVDAVRESWLIEDRWWTQRPIRRRYWEVITDRGRDEVVFHDLVGGGWWRQR